MCRLWGMGRRLFPGAGVWPSRRVRLLRPRCRDALERKKGDGSCRRRERPTRLVVARRMPSRSCCAFRTDDQARAVSGSGPLRAGRVRLNDFRKGEALRARQCAKYAVRTEARAALRAQKKAAHDAPPQCRARSRPDPERRAAGCPGREKAAFRKKRIRPSFRAGRRPECPEPGSRPPRSAKSWRADGSRRPRRAASWRR